MDWPVPLALEAGVSWWGQRASEDPGPGLICPHPGQWSTHHPDNNTWANEALWSPTFLRGFSCVIFAQRWRDWGTWLSCDRGVMLVRDRGVRWWSCDSRPGEIRTRDTDWAGTKCGGRLLTDEDPDTNTDKWRRKGLDKSSVGILTQSVVMMLWGVGKNKIGSINLLCLDKHYLVVCHQRKPLDLAPTCIRLIFLPVETAKLISSQNKNMQPT